MRVALKAAEQQGQITTAQLRGCGLSGGAVLRDACEMGTCTPCIAASTPSGMRVSRAREAAMAAVLACGRLAYLSWFAAAMHLEFM